MQRKHLLFASYEIHPITAGGCGVFIWHAINELLSTTDYKITLLLDIPKFECEKFINEHAKNIPNNERLQVVCLSDRIPWEYLPLETFNNVFMFKSYMFYRVIESMVEIEQIDYVEFFDYVGIGYFSVNAKKYEGKFHNTILGIRGHCTVDLMDLEQCQCDFSEEKIEMYQMEKIALQNADVVLVQTEAWKSLYATRYGINLDKIRVSEPPMDNSDFPKYEPKQNNNVLFYGRVFQLKGIDDYIQVGIQYLTKYKEKDMKFYIVGYDGTTKSGKSYTSYLKEKIPQELENNFVFTGKLNREDFKAVLDDVCVAVFPNYVESFCYSIHEIWEAGVPIICRNIPAFISYFNETNASVYKNNQEMLKLMRKFTHNIQLPYGKKNKSLLNGNGLKVYDELIVSLPPRTELQTKIKDVTIIYLHTHEENSKRIELDGQIIDLYNNKNSKKFLIPISFLGRYYWMEQEHLNTELKQIVVVLDNSINISVQSLEKGIEIVNNTDCSYITYLEKREESIRYKGLDINKENLIRKVRYIPPIIFENNAKSIFDLYEMRCGIYGFLNRLGNKGYTLLLSYEITETVNNLIQTELCEEILYHQMCFSEQEFNPIQLYSYLEKSSTMSSNKIENEPLSILGDRSFSKKVYHNLKSKLYKSKFKSTKYLILGLDKFKEFYKCQMR